MDDLQKKKLVHDKESKFTNYLTRLVDAKRFKEVGGFNGVRMLNDFVLDKNSIINAKKK